jgi:2-oxoglutarate ferredoxin oxidoreductase subunit alpha
MGEFAGLAYYAELPGVVFDIQRVGPSTGLPTRTSQGDITLAALNSHGDTKHVLLIPASVDDCYQMAMDAFDLAERLQTLVFVMSDLDLGMNTWMADPFPYPTQPLDRGKLLSGDAVKRMGGQFGRYLDIDGDGIPYRSIPGDGMPAYFCRGSGHNAKGQYSERPDDYQNNLDRLARKFETAKTLVPKPLLYPAEKPARFGAIFYGSTSPSMQEALHVLAERGIHVNALRVRAFPFQEEINDFVAAHPWVFVIEQNRDAQLKTMLVNESKVNPTRLLSICHYDGTPITARYIVEQISQHAAARTVVPLKRVS